MTCGGHHSRSRGLFEIGVVCREVITDAGQTAVLVELLRDQEHILTVASVNRENLEDTSTEVPKAWVPVSRDRAKDGIQQDR